MFNIAFYQVNSRSISTGYPRPLSTAAILSKAIETTGAESHLRDDVIRPLTPPTSHYTCWKILELKINRAKTFYTGAGRYVDSPYRYLSDWRSLSDCMYVEVQLAREINIGWIMFFVTQNMTTVWLLYWRRERLNRDNFQNDTWAFPNS